MAANKIFEVGETLSMSSQHMNIYFQNRQWQAECELLKNRELSNLTDWLPFVQDQALAIRLSSEHSEEVLKQFPRLPTNVNWLATADVLLLEKAQWWPRLYMYETLRTVLIHRFANVDTSLCAYIVGATHKGRAAAAALAAMGFSQIRFIDTDPLRMIEEVQLLKRYLFGVEITMVSADALTMETTPGSLMLNTVPPQDHGTVLKDLSYFNFMKRGSVVIDTADCNHRNAFLDEADSAGLHILSGVEYQSQWDVDLLTHLFPQQYITYEDYLESFTDSLAAIQAATESGKNQPSV